MLGVDGCRGGWVGALVRGGALSWHALRDAPAVLALADAVGAAAVAVDIPMGLPDDGPRDCDRAARAALAPYGARVFPAPVRAVLAARSYAEACTLSRAARGVAVSRQTWFITGKVVEWDAMLTPALQQRVVEAHPELTFVELCGRPLSPKRSPEGRAARLAALGDWLPDLAGRLTDRPREARIDDALDAAACAWTASRWAARCARVLPNDAPADRRGLAMRIVT